jgi:acyl carrier protein
MKPRDTPSSGDVTEITLEDARAAIRKTLGADADGLEIAEGTHLDGLGLSSLEVVEVFFALETLSGHEVDSNAAGGVQTVGELIAIINTGPDRGSGR